MEDLPWRTALRFRVRGEFTRFRTLKNNGAQRTAA
jgi:hypothetical protein